MGKSNLYSNGQLLVGLDNYGQVDDLYYPYVGLENHTSGNLVHKIGVFVDGAMSWIDNGKWEICFNCEIVDRKRLVTAINTEIGVQLKFNDEVYNEKNIFIRGIEVFNLAPKERNIQVFFNQQFEIYESHRGDTAYYDPRKNLIVHYKGRRIFLVNAKVREDGSYFDDYSVDIMDPTNNTGSYRDAEDGKLVKRAIEYGLVDSTIGITLKMPANSTKTIDYWLVVAKSVQEAEDNNEYVEKKTVAYLLESTKDYWTAWGNKVELDYKDLSQDVAWLYEKSIQVMRHNTDNSGAIIASVDADLLKYGRDTYSYVWPRDASLVTIAFAKSGYTDQLRKIFEFFKNIIYKEGFFMQKYRADGSLGSSWHSWIYNGKQEYPIQLDETALVVYALWEAFLNDKDIEFIESIYNDLLVKAVDFIMTRVDPETGIVKPSYDLWEEVFASSTFTSAAVYGAFYSATKLAKFFGKDAKSEEYARMAVKVRDAILKYHYDPTDGTFYKYLMCSEDNIKDTIKPAKILDSSCLYGVHRFHVLSGDDERILSMQKVMKEKLQNPDGIGGYPRYENDIYFRNDDTGKGNPWIITTLWMGQLEIKQAKTLEELKKTKSYLEWACKYATQGGMLAEQLNARTGEQLSATPLTWSHADYVVTVREYLKRYNELSDSII